MANYQLTSSETIIRTGDGASIPNDPRNRDRAEYDAWVKAGGVPDPVPPPSAAETTEANRLAAIKADAGRIDLITRFRTATPAQIDTFIDANVTTIAQARTLFKAILKTIALDGRG